MKPRLRHIPLLLLSAIAATLPAEGLRALPRPRDKAATEESDLLADTVIQVDRVQVTAIKQGLMLRSEPVASSILGERMLERRHVDALKDASLIVPNLHIPDYGSRMTSSIYVRGLGARIDQPVMGLNVDTSRYSTRTTTIRSWPTSSASRCCAARSRPSTAATRWGA